MRTQKNTAQICISLDQGKKVLKPLWSVIRTADLSQACWKNVNNEAALQLKSDLQVPPGGQLDELQTAVHWIHYSIFTHCFFCDTITSSTSARTGNSVFYSEWDQWKRPIIAIQLFYHGLSFSCKSCVPQWQKWVSVVVSSSFNKLNDLSHCDWLIHRLCQRHGLHFIIHQCHLNDTISITRINNCCTWCGWLI